jgi:hypothetical protein
MKTQIDLTKLITLMIVDVGIILLAFNKIIDSQSVVAVLSASLGYVFGNGSKIIEAKLNKEK